MAMTSQKWRNDYPSTGKNAVLPTDKTCDDYHRRMFAMERDELAAEHCKSVCEAISRAESMNVRNVGENDVVWHSALDKACGRNGHTTIIANVMDI